MITIYPFTGLHPSDEAFAVVPSVPYDVISVEDVVAEIAKNDKTLLRVIRTDAELMPNCRILIHTMTVFMSVPVRCL